MMTRFLSAGLFFSFILLLLGACKGRTIEANNVMPGMNAIQNAITQQEAKPWIVISKEKGILYNGNMMDAPTFRKTLRDTLTTLALNRELPIDIPIVYEGEFQAEEAAEIQQMVQEATQIARSMLGLQLSNRMK